MRMPWFVVAASVVVLGGCSQVVGDDGECTLVGGSHGVGVAVAADVAPVRDLRLRICADGACTLHRVSLAPGTSSAGTPTCEGTGDDATCSGELTSDGTQHGFVTAELPAGPWEVSGSYRAGGRTVALAKATVVGEVSYPNGPDCRADGVQAQVSLDREGLA